MTRTKESVSNIRIMKAYLVDTPPANKMGLLAKKTRDGRLKPQAHRSNFKQFRAK